MKYVLITCLALLFTFDGIGQAKKISFKVEAGYLSGIGQINYGDALAFDNSSSAVRLRLGCSYFFTKHFSLGVAFGLDGYGQPVNNTAPILLEAKQFLPFQKKLIVVALGVGSSRKITQEFEKGFYFSSSVGYVISSKRGNWVPSFGYNLQQIAEPGVLILNLANNTTELINDPFYINSLSFNLAFEF